MTVACVSVIFKLRIFYIQSKLPTAEATFSGMMNMTQVRSQMKKTKNKKALWTEHNVLM